MKWQLITKMLTVHKNVGKFSYKLEGQIMFCYWDLLQLLVISTHTACSITYLMCAANTPSLSYIHKSFYLTIKRFRALHWFYEHEIHIHPFTLMLTYLSSSFPTSRRALSSPPSLLRSLSLSFMKSAYVLRGILLSQDTNLHKVHAIISSREANYFPGNLTLSPSFIIY